MMHQMYLFNSEEYSKEIPQWAAVVRCRCGGALIEVHAEHRGPVHCGEEACELLPRLPQRELFTPGDTRAIYDASISSPRGAYLKK